MRKNNSCIIAIVKKLSFDEKNIDTSKFIDPVHSTRFYIVVKGNSSDKKDFRMKFRLFDMCGSAKVHLI